MAVKKSFGHKNLSCMHAKYALSKLCVLMTLLFQNLQIKSPSTSARAEEQIFSDPTIIQVTDTTYLLINEFIICF